MKKLIFVFLFLAFFNFKVFAKDYFILSIDGGGSRGVIPAAILKNLEADILGSCAEAFDCISGTSTGSILAVGLSMPDPFKPKDPIFKAQDLLKMYLDDVPNIFSNSTYYNIKNIWGWYGPKYQKDNLKRFLLDKFSTYKMKDSLTDLIITSFDLVREKSFYFENFKQLSSPTQDYFASEAILSSTSAPSYFPPEIIQNDSGSYALIDGGMIANDPSALALRECIKNRNLKGSNIYILSIGCGVTDPAKIDLKKVESWGLAEFLPEIIDTLFDSIQVDTIEEIEVLKKFINVNYIRANITLDPSECQIDIKDRKVLEDLAQKAEKFYQEDFKSSKDGQKLIQLLKDKIKYKSFLNRN